MNFWRWLDSNHRPLELEATALSTEPHPLEFNHDEKFNLFLLTLPQNESFYHRTSHEKGKVVECYNCVIQSWSEFRRIVLNFNSFVMRYISIRRRRNGSGCGSVGRAVASETRGPQSVRIQSSANFYIGDLFVYCQLYWKDGNKDKEAGNGPFKLKRVNKAVLNQLKAFRLKFLAFK